MFRAVVASPNLVGTKRRMLKGPGLKFSAIKCKFQFYDNISPKLKSLALYFGGIIFFFK